MKRVYTLLCVTLTMLVVACGPTHVVVQSDTPPPPPPPPPAPAPPPAITYQTFYDALSPYGQWVDYPGSGYVWVPNVGPDFKPYSSGGHWVYSDEGWTWMSDYSWGWAPFHYGRWFFDDNYGWCWVPGYQWAPAWVSWRSNQGYYGWAPLSPTVGVSVTIAAYNPPPHVWCFVPAQYVASPQVRNYYVNETQNVTIIQRTTVINNYTTVNNIHNTTINNTTVNNTTVNNTTVVNNRNVFVGGPPRAEVEAVTHTQIHPVTFRESAAPGAGGVSASGQMTIYRPAVNTPPASAGATGSVHTPAPARVAPFKPGATPSSEAVGGGYKPAPRPAQNTNPPANGGTSVQPVRPVVAQPQAPQTQTSRPVVTESNNGQPQGMHPTGSQTPVSQPQTMHPNGGQFQGSQPQGTQTPATRPSNGQNPGGQNPGGQPQVSHGASGQFQNGQPNNKNGNAKNKNKKPKQGSAQNGQPKPNGNN